MGNLVSLQEAKDWLRVDQDHQDATIYLLVEAASDAVRATADSWNGIGDAPARLKLACLVRVAAAFEGREDLGAGEGEDRLLFPFRVLGV